MSMDLDVKIRVQPARQAKIQLGQLTKWEPEGTSAEKEKSDDRWWQFDRIKRYGIIFNETIKMWQTESKSIRQFFLDGIITEHSSVFVIDEKFTKDENARYELRAVENRGKIDLLDHLESFWKVMNSATLSRFEQDTILFRGVSHSTTDQLPNIGYVLDNIVTNWTSSSKIAECFGDKTLYQCKFPKGTRYFFTGEGAFNEFEFIIPGGRLVVEKSPSMVTLSDKEKTLTRLVPLRFEAKQQEIIWPSASKSPSTREQYQISLKESVMERLTFLIKENKYTNAQIKSMIRSIEQHYLATTFLDIQPILDADAQKKQEENREKLKVGIFWKLFTQHKYSNSELTSIMKKIEQENFPKNIQPILDAARSREKTRNSKKSSSSHILEINDTR